MNYFRKMWNAFGGRRKRVVALLAARNESLYLERCLTHLYEQGIETCIMDNESTDATIDIARKFLNRCVFRIESVPYNGAFELANVLNEKQRLAEEIDADWFIHHDADEIRQTPWPSRTLYEGIIHADQEGYNAVHFDEFVFLPSADDESFETTDYVEAMRYYYFFEPGPLRRVNAWKNTGQKVDLVSSGGHNVNFPGKKIYPENFVLRHYIVLSRSHAVAKYGKERVYSREAVERRGWHGPRANFNPARLKFPERQQLKLLSDKGVWDKSDPWTVHTFFEGKNP